MSNRAEIKSLASAIAANAEMIAANPNDWSDSLLTRTGLIAEDLEKLQRVLREARSSGGDR